MGSRRCVVAAPNRGLRCGWSGRCAELTTEHGAVHCVDALKLKVLGQENRELSRANEILKRAASFFGAELARQHKK